MELIRSCWNEKAPIRSITITGANLVSSENVAEQLSLFGTESSLDKERLEKLDRTMDKIREKYGKKAICLGGVVKNDSQTEEK